MSAEALLVANLALIERIVASICRRSAVFGDDVAEFGSWAKLRLIEDEYRRLRAFAGGSSLATYLSVTLHNLFRDWRNSRWGKWRPSAAARRLGEVAVQLETLLHRDGLRLAEAVEMLVFNAGVEASREELEELAERLPARAPGRRFEGTETLERLAGGPTPEEEATRRELAGASARLESALASAVAALAAEDAVLLRLRFFEGLKVADIARVLRLEQKPLYRRLELLLGGLRRELEAAGAGAAQIAELLDAGRFGRAVEIDFGGAARRAGEPPAAGRPRAASKPRGIRTGGPSLPGGTL